MNRYGGGVTDHVLEQLVHELRETIEQSTSLAGEERAQLETLARRLDEHVEEEHDGLIDHISDSVGQFETDHPALTQTLNRIANALNAAGL